MLPISGLRTHVDDTGASLFFLFLLLFHAEHLGECTVELLFLGTICAASFRPGNSVLIILSLNLLHFAAWASRCGVIASCSANDGLLEMALIEARAIISRSCPIEGIIEEGTGLLERISHIALDVDNAVPVYLRWSLPLILSVARPEEEFDGDAHLQQSSLDSRATIEGESPVPSRMLAEHNCKDHLSHDPLEILLRSWREHHSNKPHHTEGDSQF